MCPNHNEPPELEGPGHKNMIFRNFSDFFLGCLPPVNSLTWFQKCYFRPPKKRGFPPKMAQICQLFVTFGPFYVVFGSVWPSKQAQHQCFVSWNLYLGYKKSWCDRQVKEGGLIPKNTPKFSLFFRPFYIVLGSFRPSKWAFCLLSGQLSLVFCQEISI